MQSSKGTTDLRSRCYQFSINVISLADTLPNKRSTWVITDQLIRSATSIGANIIEAPASSSRIEFKKFYEIALKSANETIYWLNLLKDGIHISQEKIKPLINEATEISKMLGASVITLKQKHF